MSHEAVRLRVLVSTGETHHYCLREHDDHKGDWFWSDDGRRLIIRPDGSKASRIVYPVGSVVKVDVVLPSEVPGVLDTWTEVLDTWTEVDHRRLPGGWNDFPQTHSIPAVPQEPE